MNLEAELSYYPFAVEDYKLVVKDVLNEFEEFNLEINYTPMSTIVFGEYKEIKKLIDRIIEKYFINHPSILEVKFSNACSKSGN